MDLNAEKVKGTKQQGGGPEPEQIAATPYAPLCPSFSPQLPSSRRARAGILKAGKKQGKEQPASPGALPVSSSFLDFEYLLRRKAQISSNLLFSVVLQSSHPLDPSLADMSHCRRRIVCRASVLQMWDGPG